MLGIMTLDANKKNICGVSQNREPGGPRDT